MSHVTAASSNYSIAYLGKLVSGQIQCLNVVPTVTMLGIMKVCLTSATRVHALLKKKKDALTG
ncbi:v-type proton atpase subunit d [Quercus suber]|uniref:V-type proton atpase subunit d n=1 Tax=Quercus suber TaxID=58331 RepID=A0AAW0L0U5_QUESU